MDRGINADFGLVQGPLKLILKVRSMMLVVEEVF
jgi:hypothetical protein